MPYLIITCCVLFIISSCFFIWNFKILKRNSFLEKEIENIKIDYLFIPGGRALLRDFGLNAQGGKIVFRVDFEVNILDVSQTQIKVSAYDYSTNDNYPGDPKNKQNIIDFFQNQWIDKSKAELILSDGQLRDIKLNKILK